VSTAPTILAAQRLRLGRFAEDPEIRSHGPLYAGEAKKVLKDDLEHVSIQNIQACILIGNICLGDSDPDAESLYFGEILLHLGKLSPAYKLAQSLPTAWLRY
jgi:hypothetical protein